MSQKLGAFVLLICVLGTSVYADGIQMSPEAKELLERVSKSYEQLTSLKVAGNVQAVFDVAGEQKNQEAHFTGSYAAPNLFRHDMSDDLLIGSTGQKFYGYQKAMNAYIAFDAKKDEKPDVAALPAELAQILQLQDPNILLSLIKDPGAQLSKGAGSMDVSDPMKVGGAECHVLVIKQLEPPRTVSLAIDPDSHLIRQMKMDVRKQMERAGASDVKHATITITYSQLDANGEAKKEAEFAWAAPDGAKDLRAMHMAGLDISAAAAALIDKDAPDFTLEGLDGKSVHLADLKGSVIVLDFWATWCGPCVVSLPKLDNIYRSKSGEGLKGFAVNQAEDKAQVQEFVTQTQLGIPVLLDSHGDVGAQFGVEGIPQTVVIGKDGKVKKVFVGSGIEVQLRQAVEDAMK